MWMIQEDVGAVGARLYYPDDMFQYAGVILGIMGVAGYSHKNFPRSSHGNMGRINIIKNLSAVTGGCMMMRKKVFDNTSKVVEIVRKV